jgi:hypothetical protein
MRKVLLSALATTVMLSAILVASRATAASIESATPAAAPNGLIREASIVCGGNGCNVVQTKGVKQRKLQWLGHG